MIKVNYDREAGTRCSAPTEEKLLVFNLSSSGNFPLTKKIPGQRPSFEESSKYRNLKKSILRYGKVYEPILITPDGYVLDGNHRLKIVKELWEKGIDVKVKVEVERDVPPEIVELLMVLQDGKSWSGEDFIRSQAEIGNKPAQYILELSERKVGFNQRGIFGLRNALVLTYGGIPSDNIMPVDLDPMVVVEAERLFEELNTILTMGNSGKVHIRQNNWSETFVKAWRRIRTNNVNTMKEDEEGVKTTIDTKVLNNMIDELGIELIGSNWAAFAKDVFSTARLGRWIGMIEKMVLQLYNAKHKRII